MGDDLAVDRNRLVASAAVEDGLQFLVDPGESRAGRVVRPIGSRAGSGVPGAVGGSLPGVGGSGSRVIHTGGIPRAGVVHRSRVRDGAERKSVLVDIDGTAVRNVPVAVVAPGRIPAILDDPVSAVGASRVIIVADKRNRVVVAVIRQRLIIGF